MSILFKTIVIIALITLIILSLPLASLASEQVSITGTWKGITIPIPIELNKGDRIIADFFIVEDSVWVQITSPSGNIIDEGIDVKSFHIDYTAENSETISFAIMWFFGTGNPEYYLTYTIYPIGSIQPPLVATTYTPTTAPASGSKELPLWIWSAGGSVIIVLLMITLILVRNRNKQKKDHDQLVEYTTIDEEVGDTFLIENLPKVCKRCKGTGRIKRGVMPVRLGGEIKMKEIYYECLICGGTGWIIE